MMQEDLFLSVFIVEKELFNEKDEKYKRKKLTTLLITRANNNDIILKYSAGGQYVSVQDILYANTISKVVIEFAHDLGENNKK
jgi:hypothetical protein